MTDFRITTTFFGHVKTLKLMRKLDAQICASASGADGVLSLLMLWAYAAENRRKGVLSGMNAEDIEAVSRWNGEAGSFVQCLVDVGFLDISEDGVFSLHNWEDRNPWAFHADERSEAAKAAANARWEKRKNADGMRGAMRKDAKCNADACKEQCPSPNPIPSPKHKTLAQNCATFDASRFETFWKIFPKKRDKKKALEAFKKLNPDDQLLETMLKAVNDEITWRSKMKETGQFVPEWKYGQGWISGRRWEDEFTTTTGQQSIVDSSRIAFEDLPTSL